MALATTREARKASDLILLVGGEGCAASDKFPSVSLSGFYKKSLLYGFYNLEQEEAICIYSGQDRWIRKTQVQKHNEVWPKALPCHRKADRN